MTPGLAGIPGGIGRAGLGRLVALGCGFAFSLSHAAPAPIEIRFTDETFELPEEWPGVGSSVELSRIDRDGLVRLGTRDLSEGAVTPEGEGIHILESNGLEVRFLAVDPIPDADLDAWVRQWPFLQKARNGENVTLGFYGDSVTHTGHYPEILVKLLERAIGRPGALRIVRRAHPGKSIDATVRSWEEDIASDPPDAAFIMYGLNDQAAGSSLAAFLDQVEYLAGRLRSEYGSEVFLLQPTPHIDVFPKDDQPERDPTTSFRVVGFAEALNQFGAKHGVPVVDTFDAIWRRGGESLLRAAEAMRPLFPPHHRKPLESMIESAAADTIHPNALGHVAIAQAIVDRLTGSSRCWLAGLEIAGRSEWVDNQPVSSLSFSNTSKHRREFSADFYALPDRVWRSRADISLAPGETKKLKFHWEEVADAASLLDSPTGREIAANRPIVAVVLTENAASHVKGIIAPFDTAQFTRRRWNEVESSVVVPFGDKSVEVEIPAESEVGSIPLIQRLPDGAWAVADLGYVRYAGARAGEAEIDGLLDDWSECHWSTLGDPFHARWTKGPLDNRENPEECRMEFALRAGAGGVFIAIRAEGDLARDHFTLFFDSRGREDLGTPGVYYWISGRPDKEGTWVFRAGETSPRETQVMAMAQNTEIGMNFELFIPYEAIGLEAWPNSGDLGFSFWWNHTGEDGKVTRLLWSDRGHPWNPRWFGVVRLDDGNSAPRPYMVRVE